MKLNRLILSAASVAMLVGLAGCSAKGNFTGRTFMPDMQFSNAYDAYSTYTDINYLNESERDRQFEMTAREPVEGTIPYGFIPNDDEIKTNESYLMSYMMKNHFTYDPEKYNEEYALAGEMLKNPLEKTDDLMAQASMHYTTFCAVCHGSGGEGDGQIVVLPDGSDGPYTAIPPAYTGRIPGLMDGQIFYSITFGKNQMGGYASQLSVEQRWALVYYVKDLAGVGDEAAAEEPTMEEENTDEPAANDAAAEGDMSASL